MSVFIERGITFLLPWYVARILGREAWGDFSTAYAYILIAATIAPWGLVGLLPRHIARDQQQVGRVLVNSSIIGLVVSGLTIVVMLVVVPWLDSPILVQNLIYLGLLLVIIPQMEATLFESVIQGLERMEWIMMVRLPSTIIRIVASIYFLHIGYGIEILFVLLAGYYALNTVFYWLIFRHYVLLPSIKVEWSAIWILFVQAWPFFLIISVSEMFKQVDRIFLSTFWNTDTVGIYATGVMFTQLLYMVAPAMMGALFPGLARAYSSSPTRFSYLLSWLFKLFLIGTLPLMFFTISFAQPMIEIVFGLEYQPSIIVLQLTALGIVPSFLSRLLYRATLASDNERFALKVAIGGNISSLLLNLLLIPRYGVIGAGVAMVGVIAINLAQNFWYVTKFAAFDFKHALWRPGFCALVACLVYSAVAMSSFPAAFGTAVATFAFLLLLTGSLSREDLANLHLVKP